VLVKVLPRYLANSMNVKSNVKQFLMIENIPAIKK